jgi:hypothetical protein
MTEKEARNKHLQLKSIHGLARALLLEMRDRKGWLVLGFSSFEDYGEKEWNYSQSYIYRLSKADEIQATLSPIGEIPETHLRPLGSVPEAERQAIFDEANRKAEEANKERTAKMVEDAVKEWKERNKQLTDEWRARAEENKRHIAEMKESVDHIENQLTEQEQEYKDKLYKSVTQLDIDYTAKINDQTDTISYLKEQLVIIKEANKTEKTQQKLDELNQSIATKKTILEALQKQQDAAFSRKKIDDDFAIIADKLAKEVQSFMQDLLISYDDCPTELYPKTKLSARNKNKMLHAATVFSNAAREIQLLDQD